MSRKKPRRKPKKYPNPLKQKKHGSGAAPLFIGGAVCSLFGLAQSIKPIAFQSQGGLGQYGEHKVLTVYDQGSSRGFGVFFVLIGLFLLYWGYYTLKSSKSE